MKPGHTERNMLHIYDFHMLNIHPIFVKKNTQTMRTHNRHFVKICNNWETSMDIRWSTFTNRHPYATCQTETGD